MSDLLNKASLVMVPSGYKEDTVYSVVPTDGSGDLSFTRASNGTRVNSAGLVEVCPWNFNTTSENFTANWGTDGTSTATNNFTTAPNGTTTAAKVVANSPSGYGYKFLPVSAGVYTLSLYVKANINSTFSLALNDINGSGLNQSSIFNVTTEWQRFEFSCNITDGALLYINYDRLQTSREYYFWGLQLNIGSTAKPYFPTTDRLNVPRLTYQNGGGGCPSLLLEKQSTNLVTYSEDFSNADWLKQQATISANATTSPDGTQNADKLIINNGVAGGYVYQLKSTSSGTVYTGSFYVKAGGVGYTKFWTNISGSYEDAVINLSTGAITNSNFAITPTAQSVGNGWYRVVYTTTSGGGQVVVYVDGGSTSTGGSYTGNGTDGIFLWGAQLEASSYPTSYIPTTSSSATRVADACYKTGISSLIGQTEGTLFADVDLTHTSSGNDYILQIFQDSSNRILLYRGLGNIVGCYLLKAGGSIYDTLTVSAFTGRTKLAFAYKSGSIAFYVNGSQIGTSSATFTAFSSLSDLNIDSNNGTENGYFSYNEVVIFPTRLTNAELASLTTI